MRKFYSHGKLLISGEYAVLDGAKALAIPTRYGQHLNVKNGPKNQLIWKSYGHDGHCWLEATFDLPLLRLSSATYFSEVDDGSEDVESTLQKILNISRELNPNFLIGNEGFEVATSLEFPRGWGLGSSSTLIQNLASWAGCDPYNLLNKTFGGSGYDLACAVADSPILYSNKKAVEIENVAFDPSFKDQLFFVHLNQKQNSRAGIDRYRKSSSKSKMAFVGEISNMANQFVNCSDLSEFEQLIKEHEFLVSKQINLPTVQNTLFPDYYGQTKSLGAWGGDFILATGSDDSPSYFKKKGFETIIKYKDMALK